MRVSSAILAALWAGVTATAAEVRVNGLQFVVPEGFTVELGAGTNLVQRPISASFDDLGRLYVTDSDGSNEAPERQLKNPGARILRLEDTDGDGLFDRSVVFADKVMFPQGCLWHDGSVYMAGPPSIWKFTDTNGDGVADQREEWFKGGTLTGCANDIHGPYLGPDGYLYWTKGAFAEQTHTLGNGQVLKDKAAHIYRARADGGDLDVIMSGGMDNPVEVAFTPEGEAIFSSTFIDFSQPGFRDGIGHAIYGGVFGKVNDVLDDGRVRRTGPDLFHPFFQAGPAAECGLMSYRGEGFGPDFRGNLFATTFNLHKVTRHVLRPNGATFASTDSDFLTTEDVDFHPTDVLEDADGSLLVVNTGGWYKLCCPSSQLAKPDVLGAIYRVRRSALTKVEDPWGRKLDWNESTPSELISRLGDPRPAVRQHAMRTLAKADRETIGLLGEAAISGKTADIKIAALWTLARIDHPAARSATFKALDNSDARVAQVAVKTASLHRDPSGAARIFNHAMFAAGRGQVHLARVAVEALGRIGAGVEVNALVKATTLTPTLAQDPFFQHSVIFALIEIGDRPVLRRLLSGSNPVEQRAALIALDQMDGSDLKATEVTPFLHASDERLRTAANWILGRHSDWGGELAGWFRKDLAASASDPQRLAAVCAQLRILTRDPAGQQLLSDIVSQPPFPAEARVAALNAMADAGLKEPPAAWRTAALAALALHEEGGAELLPAAFRAARTVNPDPDVQHALRTVAAESALAPALRLDACASLPGGASLSAAEFAFVRSRLGADNLPSVRATAANLLARAKLTPAQLHQLTGDVKSAGPLEVTKLLGAFDGGGDDVLGRQLIASLREGKSARALTPAQLRPHFAKFPESTRAEADQLFAELNTDATQQAAQLESLLKELQGLSGDTRRGQTLFNGSKAACASCHRIGYLGGDVGPELTKIGEVRSERDLLEAMIYPSASFVRSYEPTTVVLTDGEEVNGIIRRETDAEITLVTGPNVEQRLPKSQVRELRPGTISVMPSGFDAALTKQELADLLTFVKTVRWR
ncbi:MAG TPA: c-type cytochrome [Verrucomicrobiota bacterium]|nr:dehydrogenase [Verrucomicrobiales bacterium]HRI12996.1 c-type cytochrome [Verrucomicrobiota bacterium]